LAAIDCIKTEGVCQLSDFVPSTGFLRAHDHYWQSSKALYAQLSAKIAHPVKQLVIFNLSVKRVDEVIERSCQLLQCMGPLLALFGHGAMSELSPLSGG
jgi:hypothetical protein